MDKQELDIIREELAHTLMHPHAHENIKILFIEISLLQSELNAAVKDLQLSKECCFCLHSRENLDWIDKEKVCGWKCTSKHLNWQWRGSSNENEWGISLK